MRLGWSLLTVATLAACATAGQRTAIGAGGGAAVGAGVGALAGGGRGALIGAVVGGLAGGEGRAANRRVELHIDVAPRS